MLDSKINTAVTSGGFGGAAFSPAGGSIADNTSPF